MSSTNTTYTNDTNTQTQSQPQTAIVGGAACQETQAFNQTFRMQVTVPTNTQTDELRELMRERRARNQGEQQRMLERISSRVEQVYDKALEENPDLDPFQVCELTKSKLHEQAQVVQETFGFSGREDWTLLVPKFSVN